MKQKFELPHCETCQARLQSVFNELNRDELEELSLHKGCNFHSAGQILFYEGNSPTGLYCMNRGKVKLFKTDSYGKEQIVRLAKEGDMLGYRSLLSGEKYKTTAEVMEDATICFVPKNTFSNLLHRSASVSLRTLQLLCRDLAIAEQKELSLSRKPVRERVAETLLMLKEFYGFEKDNTTIQGSLSREELANIVGASTETVIRMLSKLKQEKIIDLDGKKIKILNHQALVNAAHINE